MAKHRKLEPLEWEISAPLLTNRFFLYDAVKALGWAGGIMAALLAIIFVIQGEPRIVIEMLPVLGLALVIILVLLFLVAVLFFGNRWHVRFLIDGRGVHWEQLRRTNWRPLALLAALSAQPGALGAGILASTGNAGNVSWRDIRRVKPHPAQHVISLMNSWRVMLRLYCTPANYAATMERLRERTGS